MSEYVQTCYIRRNVMRKSRMNESLSSWMTLDSVYLYHITNECLWSAEWHNVYVYHITTYFGDLESPTAIPSPDIL